MESEISVKVMQLAHGKDMPLPKYMSSHAAGMDLYAAVTEDVVLRPNEVKLIPTGICIELPVGYEAQIRPRSGLALKFGIGLVNSPGTIDADYRGEVGLIMINWGKEDFVIHRGERIGQMVIHSVVQCSMVLVNALSGTERGAGGFGHTGH